MTALTIETDWSPGQTARGRQAAWHAAKGYHWTEPLGRHSWLGQALASLAMLAALSPHLATLAAPDPTLIVAGFCLWTLLYFPRNLLNWLRSRRLTHWPSRGMIADMDVGPARVRIDGNGVAWSRRLFGESLAWAAITTIAEDRDFFVLGSGASLALLLPKTPRVRMALEQATDGLAGADAIRPAP